MNRLQTWLIVGGLGLVLAGCSSDPRKGYTTENLYPQGIESVCVEMFDNQTFRRGVEFELTHALALQISGHSPYKVVRSRSQADTVVYGSIVSINENVLTQQQDLDRPLENQVVVTVEVNWKDLRTGKMLLDDRKVRATGDYAVLLAAGRDSAHQAAANDIAVRILEAMQSDW
jgi:hypothetical protein